jgi:peptide-methionine (S)-S-oxide reductase
MTMNANRTETAVLAGGCFWCLEAVFERLKGVQSVVSGYTGGRHPQPSYEAVCTGVTGHAEAVEITFDPDVIAFRDLLEIFFAFHDPTTLNRQGADTGTQYRSAIFPQSDEQKQIAEALIAELTKEQVYDAPIVTIDRAEGAVLPRGGLSPGLLPRAHEPAVLRRGDLAEDGEAALEVPRVARDGDGAGGLTRGAVCAPLRRA